MSAAARTSAIAVHVEAAKRLLGELERHAEEALQALGQESGEELFLSAIDERAGILAQLDGSSRRFRRSGRRRRTVGSNGSGSDCAVRRDGAGGGGGARIPSTPSLADEA